MSVNTFYMRIRSWQDVCAVSIVTIKNAIRCANRLIESQFKKNRSNLKDVRRTILCCLIAIVCYGEGIKLYRIHSSEYNQIRLAGWVSPLVTISCQEDLSMCCCYVWSFAYEVGGVCLNFVAVFWRNGYNVFYLVVCKWRVILQMVIFEQEGANEI